MGRPWRRAIILSVAGLVLGSAVGATYGLWLKSSGNWRAGLPWERALMLGMDRSLPVVFDWLMRGLPWLATNLTLLPVIALFSLWLWRKKDRGELALQLVIVSLGSLIMNGVLKEIFDRPRPGLWEHRGQYAWASYPSGHAIVCVSVFFTIVLMLYRERGWRWPFAAAATLMVVVLYSRLYLGVHWPTDVLGGLLIGVVWLAVTQYAFAPFRRHATAPSIREPVPAEAGVQRGQSRLKSKSLNG
jgi:membrane-associated phospholipid phosphatase